MDNYFQIIFEGLEPEQQEVLVAHLSEAQYEGFEEADNKLIAYITEKKFDEFILRELSFKYQLNYNLKPIENQNWNALWESDFKPVIIDDFAAIRATFHSTIKNVQHEIVINPKMSFGTGHHATTCLMIRQMRKIEFTNKVVCDFGTGTGILAILAEKSGAKKVIAIDNDSWSILNAGENIDNNNCTKIVLKTEDSVPGEGTFDIFLANISRNVILENLPQIVKRLSPEGTLLISGLLLNDEEIILKSALANNLKLTDKLKENDWICLKFER